MMFLFLFAFLLICGVYVSFVETVGNNKKYSCIKHLESTWCVCERCIKHVEMLTFSVIHYFQNSLTLYNAYLLFTTFICYSLHRQISRILGKLQSDPSF